MPGVPGSGVPAGSGVPPSDVVTGPGGGVTGSGPGSGVAAGSGVWATTLENAITTTNSVNSIFIIILVVRSCTTFIFRGN